MSTVFPAVSASQLAGVSSMALVPAIRLRKAKVVKDFMVIVVFNTDFKTMRSSLELAFSQSPRGGIFCCILMKDYVANG
jgi:hypothetical protein